VIEHKLGIDPSYKSIKQKERKYTSERHETIRQEVNKFLEAGFIRPVDYLSWLVNPIQGTLIKKRKIKIVGTMESLSPRVAYPSLVSNEYLCFSRR
jgi:hypothetical protein